LPWLVDAPERKLSLTPIAWPGPASDLEHHPLFILGAARSGTSAVAHALLTAAGFEGNEEGHLFDMLTPLLAGARRFDDSKADEQFVFMKRREIENVASRMRKFKFDFAHNCREWATVMEAWLSVREGVAEAALELDQLDVARGPDWSASSSLPFSAFPKPSRAGSRKCCAASGRSRRVLPSQRRRVWRR